MNGWQQSLGAPELVVIATVAILILLILIIKFRVHPLLALVAISLGTAFATRIPFDQIMPLLIGAFGKTLGEVALLVGLGAMFGRLAEVSGGAQALAKSLIRRSGER